MNFKIIAVYSDVTMQLRQRNRDGNGMSCVGKRKRVTKLSLAKDSWKSNNKQNVSSECTD